MLLMFQKIHSGCYSENTEEVQGDQQNEKSLQWQGKGGREASGEKCQIVDTQLSTFLEF